ncbi:MAG: hypothetical protein AB1782_14415 [Cyanobacteriota bacterium]
MSEFFDKNNFINTFESKSPLFSGGITSENNTYHKIPMLSFIKSFREKVRLETEAILDSNYNCYIDKPGK